MRRSGMYTILATNGAYYVNAHNATLVFDAVRGGRLGISFRTAECGIPEMAVSLAVADVLAVLAHDADENADLRAWQRQRGKGVVSMAEYLTRRGRTAVASPG